MVVMINLDLSQLTMCSDHCTELVHFVFLVIEMTQLEHAKLWARLHQGENMGKFLLVGFTVLRASWQGRALKNRQMKATALYKVLPDPGIDTGDMENMFPVPLQGSQRLGADKLFEGGGTVDVDGAVEKGGEVVIKAFGDEAAVAYVALGELGAYLCLQKVDVEDG
jgi:hypothetical protein